MERLEICEPCSGLIESPFGKVGDADAVESPARSLARTTSTSEETSLKDLKDKDFRREKVRHLKFLYMQQRMIEREIEEEKARLCLEEAKRGAEEMVLPHRFTKKVKSEMPLFQDDTAEEKREGLLQSRRNSESDLMMQSNYISRTHVQSGSNEEEKGKAAQAEVQMDEDQLSLSSRSYIRGSESDSYKEVVRTSDGTTRSCRMRHQHRTSKGYHYLPNTSHASEFSPERGEEMKFNAQCRPMKSNMHEYHQCLREDRSPLGDGVPFIPGIAPRIVNPSPQGAMHPIQHQSGHYGPSLRIVRQNMSPMNCMHIDSQPHMPRWTGIPIQPMPQFSPGPIGGVSFQRQMIPQTFNGMPYLPKPMQMNLNAIKSLSPKAEDAVTTFLQDPYRYGYSPRGPGIGPNERTTHRDTSENKEKVTCDIEKPISCGEPKKSAGEQKRADMPRQKDMRAFVGQEGGHEPNDHVLLSKERNDAKQIQQSGGGTTCGDIVTELDDINLSPEEFDAMLATFETPGLDHL